MAQYANVNFDTYIKKADLIKVVLIENPVPENINPMKTLDDFVKHILRDKKKQKGEKEGGGRGGRGGNQMLLKLSKEIWQYLLKYQITITAEYLPSSLNVEAGW